MQGKVFGLIYTGESSMQLRDLTFSRSVAAVPFAGRYRCIDFVLSSLVNTGLSNVGIIAQKNYHSLMDHLGSGKEWELHRKHDGLFILPPFVTHDNTGIYKGTLDALALGAGLYPPQLPAVCDPDGKPHGVQYHLPRHDRAAYQHRRRYYHYV